MSDKKDNVKWGQLAIMITILIAVFTAVWAQINSLRGDMSQVKVDVATTKTDVSWIKGEFEKLSGGGQTSTLQGTNLLNRMYGRGSN